MKLFFKKGKKFGELNYDAIEDHLVENNNVLKEHEKAWNKGLLPAKGPKKPDRAPPPVPTNVDPVVGVAVVVGAEKKGMASIPPSIANTNHNNQYASLSLALSSTHVQNTHVQNVKNVKLGVRPQREDESPNTSPRDGEDKKRPALANNSESVYVSLASIFPPEKPKQSHYQALPINNVGERKNFKGW